jgi:niacin transporter
MKGLSIMKPKQIVISALLIALSLIIPITFGGYLKIYIPPFSATLASHVPSMISMLVGPTAAVMVGFGSSLGFLLILGPAIAARALIHVFFGLTGALLIKKGLSFQKALIFVAPIHALGEALIVLPFGFDFYTAFVVVGIGTLLHHFVDSAVSIGLVKALSAGFSLSSKKL